MKKRNIEHIALNLYRLKEKQGLTVENLADDLEMTPRYVYLLMNGEKTPSLYTLMKIAEIFEVTIDYLLTDNENK